jgi:hypothetical protein
MMEEIILNKIESLQGCTSDELKEALDLNDIDLWKDALIPLIKEKKIIEIECIIDNKVVKHMLFPHNTVFTNWDGTHTNPFKR